MASTSKDQVKRDSNKNTGLKKCFTAIVDRKQVNLEVEVLKLMLRRELKINLDELDQDLALILPYLLVIYIKTWPGWQRSKEYFTGKIFFKDWYDKFHKYILLKLKHVTSHGFNAAKAEMEEQKNTDKKHLFEKGKVTNRGSQTDSLAPKGFAPFTINITSRPSLLNTLVFTDSEGDVIIKQHSELLWSKITLRQLLSWPYVKVTFVCPVFSFSRKNINEHKRQVSLVSVPYSNESVEYIEEVDIIDKTKPRSCYSLDYLKYISTQLISTLRAIMNDTENMVDICTVINEFMVDVQEIGFNDTIATNTSIIFNIGHFSYFRNKKLSKGPPSRMDVGYNETIIPKMEISLDHVESHYESLMMYLNNMKQLGIQFLNPEELPKILYSCNFCTEDFTQQNEIMNHLCSVHKMEQPVLCVLCKKSYSVYILTQNRWKHTCKR